MKWFHLFSRSKQYGLGEALVMLASVHDYNPVVNQAEFDELVQAVAKEYWQGVEAESLELWALRIYVGNVVAKGLLCGEHSGCVYKKLINTVNSFHSNVILVDREILKSALRKQEIVTENLNAENYA